MKFKKIAVLGLGLIGGSLVKAIKKYSADISVGAWDVNTVLDRGFDEELIDRKYDSIMDALEADLIFLALPVDKSVAAFEQLIPDLSEGQIISDLCSVKSVFNKLWNSSDSRGTYIGGHPMAGKELSGFSASDGDLFKNSVFIVSGTDESDRIDQGFLDIIEGIGCRVVTLRPEVHDRIVAKVSHVPQLVSTALMNVAGRGSTGYSGQGFRDMTRIAGSNFEMWKSVLDNNREEVIRGIDSIVDELNRMKYSLHYREFNKLEKCFMNSEELKASERI